VFHCSLDGLPPKKYPRFTFTLSLAQIRSPVPDHSDQYLSVTTTILSKKHGQDPERFETSSRSLKLLCSEKASATRRPYNCKTSVLRLLSAGSPESTDRRLTDKLSAVDWHGNNWRVARSTGRKVQLHWWADQHESGGCFLASSAVC
jgi:hypothetical protein